MLNLNNKSFSIVSLGCKVNRAEVDLYSANLILAGWQQTKRENAHLIIINTCTVTAVADKKTRQAVRKVLKLCLKDSNIIITGCASQINKDQFINMDKRIIVVSKKDVDKCVEKICNIKFDNIGSVKLFNNQDFRTRASLKIQDGCDNACTYCIVHTARGKSVSMSCLVIENQIKNMLKAGIKEIVLTGVNLAAYNDGNIKIGQLCQKLLKVLDNYEPSRLRISSVEPQNISDDFIDTIAKSNGKICRHLHIPLQSGSSKVLKEMNRHYSSEQYFNIIQKIKNKIPNIALSTDVIVGFPGETNEDFEQTLNLCSKCGFMKIHVFPYSVRLGTPAAKRIDQIPEDVKNKRAKKLRNLSEFLTKKDYESRKNTFEYVLCENLKYARTESYHQILAPNNCNIGDLVNVKL